LKRQRALLGLGELTLQPLDSRTASRPFFLNIAYSDDRQTDSSESQDSQCGHRKTAPPEVAVSLYGLES
jgi:hypothetical protein